MEVQTIKQRLGIVTVNAEMNRAIEVACQVATTDLSVLVTGESGVGKEFFPKIIHQLSPRKHGQYIAINCGAIPEGTIDSELFGHEKGSFTDAKDARKGYFEMADGGTIFLDEVAELPLSTQVRLLRVLETGEFIKVGSSKAQKTNVRVVAATNVDIPSAISRGTFREDLYYRLNTISIHIPPLRERKEDIELLFRKFAGDMSEKYRMPVLQLTPDGKEMLVNYPWKGNVRQLKNITEQISIVETNRELSAEILKKYLPPIDRNMPILLEKQGADNMSERDILYSVLFDMKRDIIDLKKVISEIAKGDTIAHDFPQDELHTITPAYYEPAQFVSPTPAQIYKQSAHDAETVDVGFHEVHEVEDSLSLEKKEIALIKKALQKHHGKRRAAAEELGISERTLYRKIKDYDLE
ncbi:MAG: sigma 54-interacting transcriptional regulator [Bacteroidales bacterium]|nr:sigma 54-interacting transcriptional regulator [Bacteroidales bacterium]